MWTVHNYHYTLSGNHGCYFLGTPYDRHLYCLNVYSQLARCKRGRCPFAGQKEYPYLNSHRCSALRCQFRYEFPGSTRRRTMVDKCYMRPCLSAIPVFTGQCMHGVESTSRVAVLEWIYTSIYVGLQRSRRTSIMYTQGFLPDVLDHGVDQLISHSC